MLLEKGMDPFRWLFKCMLSLAKKSRTGSFCTIAYYKEWVLADKNIHGMDPAVLRNEKNGFSPTKKQKEWILSKGAERPPARLMIARTF